VNIKKIKPDRIKTLWTIIFRGVVLVAIGVYFLLFISASPKIKPGNCYTDARNQIYYITKVSTNTVIYLKTIESYYNTYTERVVAAKSFMELQIKDSVIFEIDCDALSSSTRELIRRANHE
jgi:hypothetical protein